MLSGPRWLAALAALVPATAGAWAGLPEGLVERAGLVLEIRPMLVVDGQAGALRPRVLEIDPERGGKLEIDLQWPELGRTSRLHLVARGRPGPPEAAHPLHVETRLVLPDGRNARARRDLVLREGATSLFEVYGEGDSRVTLGLRVERRVLGYERVEKVVGDPVVLRLAVDLVRGEQSVELETNRLSTFMNETVEYSFRRGEGPTLEHVRVLLTPVRRTGDLLELTIEVSGSLPGTESRLLLSRSDTLFTSRGATSAFAVTSGTPPAGYRFRITPDF